MISQPRALLNNHSRRQTFKTLADFSGEGFSPMAEPSASSPHADVAYQHRAAASRQTW